MYGTSYTTDVVPHVSRFAQGQTAILQTRPSVANVVNAFGVVGGGIVADPTLFTEQAALFAGYRAEIIPRRPDETSSTVVALNNLGVAIVASRDASFHVTYLRYWHHHSTVLSALSSFVAVGRCSRLAFCGSCGPIGVIQASRQCSDVCRSLFASRAHSLTTSVCVPRVQDLARRLGCD